MSLVTAMLLSTSAYAGKIITDAPEGAALIGATSVVNTQFGFGGWNFDNVDVRIVNIEDFTTPTLGSFNTLTGVYAGMGADMSFESDIKNSAGVVLGHLHGKDWPVGEPAGIKIINGDTGTNHGKPENCIMTSSYLAAGYLDAGVTKPVLCSSSFQTHKRFKINMLPSSVGVDGAYGTPIELVFNLDTTDTDTTVRRYQILQKANNYTGKRLDGYKVEVLDASGAKNAALTFSVGMGESLDADGNPDGDIWDIEDMANFSHGLWGPADSENTGREPHHDANGFFDSARAYYPAALAADKQSISYTGDMQGGNYQDIFGNWLPSVWEPTGIFHDDDMDPETDGVLKAYWGDPLKTGTNAWHKGNDDAWALATEEDLLTWAGEWYERGPVEDVLNLGLNYIVNVGDNALIGDKFTLRITPHVAATEQVEPTYVTTDAAPDAVYGEIDPATDTSEGIVTIAYDEYTIADDEN